MKKIITLTAAVGAAVSLAPFAQASTVYIAYTHAPGADRYVTEADAQMATGDPQAVRVQYPRELAPLVGTVPLDRSVAIGVTNAVPQIHTGDTVVSISQGAVVAELSRRELASQGVTDVTWVSYGDPVNHGGGLLTKLPPVVPTFPHVTATACATCTDYAIEYDIVADAPDRPNLLSWANAVMGGAYDHATYSKTLVDTAVADGRTTSSTDAYGTHVLIQQPNLPLTRPLRQLGVDKAAVDQLDKALRPAIDAGYDRGSKPKPSTGHPKPNTGSPAPAKKGVAHSARH